MPVGFRFDEAARDSVASAAARDSLASLSSSFTFEPGGSTSSRRRGRFSRAQTTGVRKSMMVPDHDHSNFWTEHYTVVTHLGSGAFGKVQLVEEKYQKKKRVLKVVDTSSMGPLVLDITRREIAMLKTLDHPYIVKLFEFAEDDVSKELVFVLEYFDGGDAERLLKEYQGQVPEEIVGRITCQLLVAIAYCHARSVVHRDVKPENLMLTKSHASQHYDVRLIDFGLADTGLRVSTCVGTPSYMAPEVYLSVGKAGAAGTYTAAADLWSVGATVMHMLIGKTPFGSPDMYKTSEEFWKKVTSYRDFKDLEGALAESCWQELDSGAQDLIEALLRRDAHRRPLCSDALDCDWLVEHRPNVGGALTRRLVKSIYRYADAAQIIRCCAFCLAVRSDHEDNQAFEDAFLQLDEDLDGVITSEEFCEALEDAPSATLCGIGEQEVDHERVFDALDLGHQGHIAHTEFVAACIYGQYTSETELINDAFEAIDSDHDSFICYDDLKEVFGESSLHVISNIFDEGFVSHGAIMDVQEWVAKLSEAIAAQKSGSYLGVDEDDAEFRPSRRGGFFACCSSK